MNPNQNKIIKNIDDYTVGYLCQIEPLVIHHFYTNVMAYLGYFGWILNLKEGHESYCWKQSKRIDIGIAYDGDIRHVILHEIAHIGTAKYCNQKHNPQFWKRLEYLTAKILKTSLDENQRKHREYCSEGHYAIIYKSGI